MERTKRYKTDGGDTAWEEKKKQSYATSEVIRNHTFWGTLLKMDFGLGLTQAAGAT